MPRAFHRGDADPLDLVRRYAQSRRGGAGVRPRASALRCCGPRVLEYLGFELERDSSRWTSPARVAAAAGASRAGPSDGARRGAPSGGAAQPAGIEEMRECGGAPAASGRVERAELAAWYESRQGECGAQFRTLRLPLRGTSGVGRGGGALAALPDVVVIRGQDGADRLRGGGDAGGAGGCRPAASAGEDGAHAEREEVPVLDRPVRYLVVRGKRGTVRADRWRPSRSCSTARGRPTSWTTGAASVVAHAAMGIGDSVVPRGIAAIDRAATIVVVARREASEPVARAARAVRAAARVRPRARGGGGG